MLSFLAGMAYGNAGEWIMHKYVLHEIGRKRDSFWSFHWKDHHKNVRRNGFRDPDYDAGFKLDSTLTKEAALLAGAAVAHLPWHYDHHMGKDQDANWPLASQRLVHHVPARRLCHGHARGIFEER